jgi:predicted NBD/HSP70 family sugar kinase
VPIDLPPVSRDVAVEVLVHGPQSRAQLARRMGLSPATLTRVVKPLLGMGVLVETDAVRTPGRGRSSLPLDVVADAHRFVGVKLTAESIYAVATDLRARVLDSETVAEPSLDVPAVVRAVTEVVARLGARAARPLDAVGITVGGRVDARGTVTDSPFLGWQEVPLRHLLSAALGLPVHLDNDVAGLTRAQQWFGHGREHPSFALLTVGAGVGYGLVLDGRLVPTGARPLSHLLLDPHGPWCHRGHRGCLTAYVTSSAVTAAVAQGRGRPVTHQEVLRSAVEGDPLAVRVVDEAARALGRATAVVTAATGVERIVLSGEGVGLAEVGRPALLAGRAEHAAGRAGPEPVVRPMGFLEWARGAAVTAIQGTFPDVHRGDH